MRARLIVAVLAGVSLSAAVSAEPPKAPVQKAQQPAEQAAPVVVAAADETPAPAVTDPQESPPAKPVRHARVTTCRCGGQNPGE